MSLDREQVAQAVEALYNHVKNKKSVELFSNHHTISLIIGFKMIPAVRKVVRIKIPHSLHDDESEVCVITKDPQADYKKLFKSKNIKVIKKVMSVSKLQKKYKPYEAKRNLCKSYDLFLADKRIYYKLSTLLGKYFYIRKKQPIPIIINPKNLEKIIKRATHSTYMHLGTGVCSAVKIGHTGLTSTQVTENIITGIEEIYKKINVWNSIQAINLKTVDSVALPLYNSSKF